MDKYCPSKLKILEKEKKMMCKKMNKNYLSKGLKVAQIVSTIILLPSAVG